MPYTHTLYYVGTFTYHQCFDILAVRQLWFLQVHTEQRCLIKVRGPRTQTSIFWMKWLQHENGCNTFLWKGSSYLQDLSYKHNHWKSFLINMITILCSPPLFLTMSSSKKCHLCFTPTTCSSPTAAYSSAPPITIKSKDHIWTAPYKTSKIFQLLHKDKFSDGFTSFNSP